MQSEAPFLDEFHFRSMTEMTRRFDARMWVARGKPKLWVKVYDKDKVTVWREVAYGGLRLHTPDGVAEGGAEVRVGEVAARYTPGRLELKLKTEAAGTACLERGAM